MMARARASARAEKRSGVKKKKLVGSASDVRPECHFVTKLGMRAHDQEFLFSPPPPTRQDGGRLNQTKIQPNIHHVQLRTP